MILHNSSPLRKVAKKTYRDFCYKIALAQRRQNKQRMIFYNILPLRNIVNTSKS